MKKLIVLLAIANVAGDAFAQSASDALLVSPSKPFNFNGENDVYSDFQSEYATIITAKLSGEGERHTVGVQEEVAILKKQSETLDSQLLILEQNNVLNFEEP
jgi:hypothetical protein